MVFNNGFAHQSLRILERVKRNKEKASSDRFKYPPASITDSFKHALTHYIPYVPDVGLVYVLARRFQHIIFVNKEPTIRTSSSSPHHS